jgi:signal transduction histidine kinase
LRKAGERYRSARSEARRAAYRRNPDSGHGIDAEKIEQVFQPFYTTKASGMGMGLSICRSIIAAHGGRLWAEANQPVGAQFQFTLPDTDS